MLCPACDHDNIPGRDLCEHCGLDLAGLDVGEFGVDPDDPLLTKPVGRLDLKSPLVLSPSDTVAAAIARMREAHEGCVLVADESGALLGIFTERDVCARVAAPGRDPARTRLESVMTHKPTVLNLEDPLAWALHRMGVDGFRHLPVVVDDRLRGYLSSRTVLRALDD